MGTAHSRVARQGSQGVHGFQHLGRRAFKYSAAPPGKQSVSTKQDGCLVCNLGPVSNVACCVTWHVQCLKMQTHPAKDAILLHGPELEGQSL